MDKPLIILIQETETKMLSLINESKLPAFFLVRIFEKYLTELKNIANDELAKTKEQYENKNKKTKKE